MNAVSCRNPKSYTGFLYNTNLFSIIHHVHGILKLFFFSKKDRKCIISKRKILVDQRQYYDRKGLGKNCENVVGFRTLFTQSEAQTCNIVLTSQMVYQLS